MISSRAGRVSDVGWVGSSRCLRQSRRLGGTRPGWTDFGAAAIYVDNFRDVVPAQDHAFDPHKMVGYIGAVRSAIEIANRLADVDRQV